jgi:hypothetical protein
MLSGAGLLRSPEGLCSGRVLQLAIASAFPQPAEGLV